MSCDYAVWSSMPRLSNAQAGALYDDCLHLLAPSSPVARTGRKKQLKGFPLCPTRRVDLV